MNCLLADILWRPLIGERWVWWITAAHFVASWLCFSVGIKERATSGSGGDSRRSIFWFVLALLMLALSLNKLLDLQTVLTVFGRNLARHDAWYARRESLQAAIVVGSAMVGMICVAASVSVLRGRWRQCGLAYFAAVFLLTLIAIRVASYHPVDVLLYGLPVVGNRMNAGLELGSALFVSLGALLAGRRTTSTRSQRR